MKWSASTSWSSIMLLDSLLFPFMLAYQKGASSALANPWSVSGNRKKHLGSCKYRKEGLHFVKTESRKCHLGWDDSVPRQAVPLQPSPQGGCLQENGVSLWPWPAALGSVSQMQAAVPSFSHFVYPALKQFVVMWRGGSCWVLMLPCKLGIGHSV